jgi:hypothetical protein
LVARPGMLYPPKNCPAGSKAVSPKTAEDEASCSRRRHTLLFVKNPGTYMEEK